MHIERDGESKSFKVQSISGNTYTVKFENGLSLCDCPDFVYRQLARNGKCKHILAVEAEYPDCDLEEEQGESITGRPLTELL